MLVRRVSRSDLAPRRIGLQHDFVVRQRLHDLQIRFAFDGAAVDADVEAHGDEFLRLLQRSVEGVHDAAPSDLRLVGFDNFDQIVVRAAAVEEQRKLIFVGQLQLLLEVFLLHVRLAEVQAIVVQADLADGNDFVFVFLDLLRQLAEVVVGADEELAASRGMSSDCAEKAL